MLKKFKALSTLKKTTIILVLIAAFLVLAPLTVKYASAGEIDLFAMVQELFARADQQDARILELEERLAGYETQGNAEPSSGDRLTPEPGSDLGASGGSKSNTGDCTVPDGESSNPTGNATVETGDPEPEPELEDPEPEPLPPLTKVDYYLSPQVSNYGRFEYRFDGDKLHVDYYVPIDGREEKLPDWGKEDEQSEYAFTETLDLGQITGEAWHHPGLCERLPVNVICRARRRGDTLEIDLLYWFGKGAPYEVRFPERQVYVLP